MFRHTAKREQRQRRARSHGANGVHQEKWARYEELEAEAAAIRRAEEESLSAAYEKVRIIEKQDTTACDSGPSEDPKNAGIDSQKDTQPDAPEEGSSLRM